MKSFRFKFEITRNADIIIRTKLKDAPEYSRTLTFRIKKQFSVTLNRTFALYKAKGQQAALVEAEKLKLENNHFYFLLLGELYKNMDNATQTEKQGIQAKIDSLI